jgi:vancomycin resistance protein YoaR
MAQANPTSLLARLAAHRLPTRLSAALFRVKMAALQSRRALADAAANVKKIQKTLQPEFSFVVAESRSALRSDSRAAEATLQEGKIHNLRLAAAELDGVLLPTGATFSFWKQIGRTSKRRGYTEGRMLQEGCLIPAIGGGLCQLSNALYDAALQAGCEIVERHAHSRIVPGSAAAAGRDATVAWNYVDLRFRTPHAIVIRVSLQDADLVVRFCAPPSAAQSFNPRPPVTDDAHATAQTCATCKQTTCFRHEP